MSDVRDEGLDYRGRDGGYNTSAELDFHADFCDLVGLLCLADAREGGDTVLVSSIAVHDHIAATRPDLLEVLYRPFGYSLQGAGAPGRPRVVPVPDLRRARRPLRVPLQPQERDRRPSSASPTCRG